VSVPLPPHRRMNFLPSLSYHKRKGKENSSWWIWEGKNGKAKDRNAPPQTALREGAGLHSPSHMFLGLALRSLLIIRSKNRSDSPDQRAPHPSNCSIPLAIASAILSRNASLKSICSSLAFVIKRHSTSALGIVDLRLT